MIINNCNHPWKLQSSNFILIKAVIIQRNQNSFCQFEIQWMRNKVNVMRDWPSFLFQEGGELQLQESARANHEQHHRQERIEIEKRRLHTEYKSNPKHLIQMLNFRSNQNHMKQKYPSILTMFGNLGLSIRIDLQERLGIWAKGLKVQRALRLYYSRLRAEANAFRD